MDIAAMSQDEVEAFVDETWGQWTATRDGHVVRVIPRRPLSWRHPIMMLAHRRKLRTVSRTTLDESSQAALDAGWAVVEIAPDGSERRF